MQAHIDRTTTAGVYPKLDLASGHVTKLHPVTGHPMILRMGDDYVLCADFRDAAGKPVNVDFYLAPREKGVTVFQVEVANRAPLEALMKAGSVRALNCVLCGQGSVSLDAVP